MKKLVKNQIVNWVSDVYRIFAEIGLIDLIRSNCNYSESTHVLAIVKQRLIDIHNQNILSDINSSSKCSMYRHLIDHVTLQEYLCKPIYMQYKKFICKLRLSSHCLAIETGRYKNIPFDKRICSFCKEDIEDEFHFMLKCPAYHDLRVQFLKPYYYRRPSVFKLIQLLSSQNTKELCNLGKFIKKAFDIRKNI